MEFKYLDIFKLWNEAEGWAHRPITLAQVVEKSGVTQPTISRMKKGTFCDPVKIGKVAEALYELGGMDKPTPIIVAWLE